MQHLTKKRTMHTASALLLAVGLLFNAFEAFALDPGDLQWYKIGVGTGPDYPYDVVILGDGSTLVTGEFWGDLAFTGLSTLTATAYECDMFLVKFSPAGVPLWATSGGGDYSDRGYQLRDLGNGTVAVMGEFFGWAYFDSSSIWGLYDDIFRAVYDVNTGDLVSLNYAESTDFDMPRRKVTLSDGSVIKTGYFSIAEKWPGTGNTIGSAGDDDHYIMAYDSNDAVQWITSDGISSKDRGVAVDVDVTESFAVMAAFYENLSANSMELFIAAYYLDDDPTRYAYFGTTTATGSWGTVNLPLGFVDPVVVCTVNYKNNSIPVVPRVKSVGTTSFQLKLQNPSGTGVSSETVHFVVCEKGAWTLSDGRKIEAGTYSSTVTDHDASWVGQPQTFQNTYTNPVVFGQVMTENDTAWSVFWSHGTNYDDPVSNSAFYTGKHVGEDSTTARNNETVGYIVIEAGSGSFGDGDSVDYQALLGADTVQGIDDYPPYTYGSLSVSDAAVCIANQAGMDGTNGSWAYLYGSSPLDGYAADLAVDEDQIGDSERAHINEQVSLLLVEHEGYVVLTDAS